MCVFCLFFVYDDIRNIEFGCEVNVVFIGIYIEIWMEIYFIEVCVVLLFLIYLFWFDLIVVFKNIRSR